MEAGPSLDHVLLAAPPGCEDRARIFYGTILGLSEIEKPEQLNGRGGVWFALGDSHQLHIGVDHSFVAARKAHPALRWPGEELDSVASRLSDAGSPVRWDDELPGFRRFFTEDPFGNRLELLAATESE
jgi:catechol 2,3-dioxygenase-like lactoylglutathione lyase family enzyme